MDLTTGRYRPTAASAPAADRPAPSPGDAAEARCSPDVHCERFGRSTCPQSSKRTTQDRFSRRHKKRTDRTFCSNEAGPVLQDAGRSNRVHTSPDPWPLRPDKLHLSPDDATGSSTDARFDCYARIRMRAGLVSICETARPRRRDAGVTKCPTGFWEEAICHKLTGPACREQTCCYLQRKVGNLAMLSSARSIMPHLKQDRLRPLAGPQRQKRWRR